MQDWYVGQVQLLLAVLANVLLSVALVFVNKAIVYFFSFRFMTVLSCLHFIASSMMTMLLVIFACVPFKMVNNYFHIFRISLGSLLSIVFMNYCLAHSSVGFYQISKIACIPITLVIESLFGLRQQRLSLGLVFSLIVIITGMLLVIREEVTFDTTGVIWALLGVVTTSAAQVFFTPLQRDLQLNSLQLLFHTSPWLSFGSMMMIPLVEDTKALYVYLFPHKIFYWLAASCLVAVVFNISNYQLLSLVSPLTYTVIGHFKTVIIILAGSYFFQTLPSPLMSVGMVVAMCGLLLYKREVDFQAALKASSTSEHNPKYIPTSTSTTDIQKGMQGP